MPQPLPPGPYHRFPLPDGSQLSMYVIPFDREGRCEAPRTRDALLEDAEGGGYTDIYLFSHGWNNDWKVATERYRHFVEGYIGMRQKHGLPMQRPYRPLLVGVYWPGVILTHGDERPPQMAGAADPDELDAEVEAHQRAVRELAGRLPDDRVERFYDLAQRPSLTEAEAGELAELMAPLYRTDDDVEWRDQPGAEEVLESWRTLAQEGREEENLDDFGTVDGGGAGGPTVAGLFGFDPRDIVRMATVWQMKDRAGVVGTRGVGPLLDGIRKRTDARLHLLGHSYGCKVVLSAIRAADALQAGPADSLLLLQPAVNHLCFAVVVPEMKVPGGYRMVLDRVRQPVLSTFTAHDAALTKVFHVALRRRGDRGELRDAAAGDPPSVFAALGGYGPRAVRYTELPIRDPLQPYDETREAGAPRVFALNGTRTIGGHGEISNPSTWWALYEQVSEGQWPRS